MYKRSLSRRALTSLPLYSHIFIKSATVSLDELPVSVASEFKFRSTSDFNSDGTISCVIFPVKYAIAVSDKACPNLIATYSNVTITGDTSFSG